MGQLGVLLKKNFIWCKRHYIKTAMFYLVPLMFCYFLHLIFSLDAIENEPDCDYQTVVLPPSHPVFLVSSLVCSQQESCANRTQGYDPPYSAFKYMNGGGEDEPFNGNGSRSILCPWLSEGEFRQAVGMTMFRACMDRDPEKGYRGIEDIDMIFRGQLLYYPQNEHTDKLVQKMASYMDDIAMFKMFMMFYNVTEQQETVEPIVQGLAELGFASICFKELKNRTFGFQTLDEALEHSLEINLTNSQVWAVIQFIELGDHFQYNIITHYNWRYKMATQYAQSLVEAAAIEVATNKSIEMNVVTKLMPTRCFKSNNLYDPTFSVMHACISFGMIMVAQAVAGELCYEKAAGLLEFLFIAGVARWKVKVSWFLYGLVFFSTVMIMLACIFKLIEPKLIEHTPWPIFVGFSLLYGLSLLCMCFTIGSMMATAQRASLMMFVILLVSNVAPSWGQLIPLVGYTGVKLVTVRICSFLFATVAAEVGYAYIWTWEKLSVGAQWDNLGDSPVDDDGFGGLKEASIYLVLQCFMYMFLSWYFDHVAPSKYGFKKPFYFLFMPSYWSPNSKGASKLEEGKGPGAQADIEPLKEEKTAGISVRNLTKDYSGQKAVNSLTINFYHKEITALLGHNGAGKSTTMNMLTGMLSPSSGTAIIDGRDILTDMLEIRRSLGFCPQYDIIYPELTVEEHMNFYGDLKGIPRDQVQAYAMDLFKQMKMDKPQQQKTAAMNLSGGMKRKLSIAISFLGDPKIVILDEPTSAIDPFSRRAIWDVVLRYRTKSTVVISTHYMQEADILGDKIAIINDGILKCMGSPMYLKAKYGSGFFIKMAHNQSIDATTLVSKLSTVVPTKLVTTSETETMCSIPIEAVRSENMVDAFEFLESEGPEWGVVSFGISESTMEQVFFKVAADDDKKGKDKEDHNDGDKAGDKHETVLTKINYNKIRGVQLLALQFWATWVKRFHLSKRSKLGFVFQVLMPLVFTAILLFFNNLIAAGSRNPAKMHMHHFNMTYERVIFTAMQENEFTDSLIRYGLGELCMDHKPDISKHGYECESGINRQFPPYLNITESTTTCDCSKCPDDAVDPKAKRTQLTTGEALVNLFLRNITSYLLKSNEEGGYTAGIQEDRAQTLDFFALMSSFSALGGGGNGDSGGGGDGGGFLFGGFGGDDDDDDGGKTTKKPATDSPDHTGTTKKSGGGGNFGGGGFLFGGLFGGGDYDYDDDTTVGATDATQLPTTTSFAPSTTANDSSTTSEPGTTTTSYSGNFGGFFFDEKPKSPFDSLSKAGADAGEGGGGRDPTQMIGDLIKIMTKSQKNVHVLWAGLKGRLGRRPTKRELELQTLKLAFFNAHSNVLLRSMLPDDSNPGVHGIRMFTQETSMDIDFSIVQIVSGILLGMFSALSLMMPVLTVILIIVNENSMGNKQLQYLMGMSRIVYWVANFIWDVILYSISIFLVVAFMKMFPQTFEQDIKVYFQLAIVHGIGMILLSYWLSFIFKTARNGILMVGNISPIVSMTSLILLRWWQEDWYQDVEFYLNAIPPFFITNAMIIMQFNDFMPEDMREDPMSYDMLGKRIAICAGWSGVMIFLIILCELGVFTTVTNMVSIGNKVTPILDAPGDKDPDVAREEQTVIQSGAGGENVLAVKQLLKYFSRGKKLAVKGVTFGVRKGECFGLLGVNGAGKSTLFKMVTGYQPPTQGDATILGISIFKRPDKVAEHMSYCPQEDVLYESLTATEHLHFYGRVRGIPAKEREEVADALVYEVGLTAHKKKQSYQLSGGNKRKLNFAISMLDFPDVIFLDEMTTGMDPKARRGAWTCLQTAIQKGCSAVITSHSMEECEALCNRLVIMVNGSFKCMGGVQYLKDKYGNNYNIKFKLGTEADSEALQVKIIDQFAAGKMVEEHLGYLELEIPAANLTLSQLFRVIHSVKEEHAIEEFSVTQTSLEHVFVNMVRDQE